MVTARPILMSGPMVRACLNGTKAQTRRVIREARDIGARCTDEVRPFGDGSYYICAHDGTHMIGEFRCPYGKPGDLLYVREACGWLPTQRCCGRGVPVVDKWDDQGSPWDMHEECCANPEVDWEFVYRADTADSAPVERWRPSIHMPRAASRITLRITEVRVERVQDISEADAEAEGVWTVFDQGAARTPGTALGCFPYLWDDINAKRAPWDSNPWVWVVSFEAIQANVDSVLEQAA